MSCGNSALSARSKTSLVKCVSVRKPTTWPRAWTPASVRPLARVRIDSPVIFSEAVRLRNDGLSAAEIACRIRDLVPRLRLLAVVDTLKYLKMGGRLSATSAAVGSLLGIKPIVSVIGGRVEAVGKARGRKAAFQMILQMLHENPPNPDYPVCFGNSNAPEALQACISYFSPHLPNRNFITGDLGCVIGTHAGPGAVGFAYIAERPISE